MIKERIQGITIRLPASVWADVIAYRDRVGAVTLADAVRRLLLAGLRAEGKSPARE